MIRGITFDLDGVYFPNGKANFIRSLNKLGVSEDEAKRVFFKSEEMNHQYKHGLLTDQQFWTWAAEEWKLHIDYSSLINLLIDGYDVNPDVVKIVKQVRANGYKTLICSNNFPARIDGLQKKFHFLDDFDVAVLSYEVGDSKPRPKIFQELVEKSGLPAESIVFADDDELSLSGAKHIGIQTFVYHDFEGFTENLQKLGVNLTSRPS